MSNSTTEKFIKKLKLAMLEKNINQAKLAKKIGVTRAAVSAWLTGRAKPPLDVLLSLSENLEQPINYFFADVNGNGNAIGNNNNTRLETDLKNDINFIKKELEVQKLQIENLSLKIEKLQKKK